MCKPDLFVRHRPAVDRAIENSDIGSTGVGCALEAKGSTGDKQVVTAPVDYLFLNTMTSVSGLTVFK